MDVVDQGTFARAWAVQRQRVAWLLGAGASAAAGLPTATQIRDDLLLRVYADRHNLVRQHLHINDPNLRASLDQYFNGRNGMPEFGADDDYSRAFELALPDPAARHQYLQDLLSSSGQPAYGQRILGTMLSSGAADVAITTNVDSLIEESAAASYAAVHSTDQSRVLNVAALGSVDRARKVLEPGSRPLLIKLHGDFRESSLKNLATELRDQDIVLRQAVRDLSRTVGLAVIGYSGRDESVMSMLEGASEQPGAWPAGMWWFTRDPDRTPARVLDLLAKTKQRGAAAYLVQLETFDELMADVARQVDLSEKARTYVSGLRPESHLVEASPPSRSQTSFPVIRFNALPVLAAPTTALHAPAAGVDHREFRRRAQENKWRGVAVMAGGSAWGWGDPSTFSALAGAAAATVNVDLTGGLLEPGLHALLVEGLTRSVAAALPARPIINRKASFVVLAEWDQLTDDQMRALEAFKAAYSGRIQGELPTGKYGRNRRGGPRAYAEAVRIHVEFRWQVPWLIFKPYTFVESPERTDHDAKNSARSSAKRVDPAAEWQRERWVERRKNETWAALIDTWTSAIAPVRQEADIALTRGAHGDTFGGFRLGPTSAYSWRAA